MSKNTLTAQQETVADLLAAGSNVTDAAAAVGVSRQTVSEWQNQNYTFRAEVNRRRNQLWLEHTERLRSLIPKALGTLEDELAGKRRLDAAIHILRANGLNGLKPRAEETDADVMEADERQANELRRLLTDMKT